MLRLSLIRYMFFTSCRIPEYDTEAKHRPDPLVSTVLRPLRQTSHPLKKEHQGKRDHSHGTPTVYTRAAFTGRPSLCWCPFIRTT